MTFSGQTKVIQSSAILLAVLKSLAGVILGAILSLSLSLRQTTGRALVNNKSEVISCRPDALTTHQAMLHVGASQ